MDISRLTIQPISDGAIDLDLLADFKNGLLQALPETAAADAYRRALGLDERARFAWRPVGLLRQAAEAGAAAFHEFAAGGEGFVAEPPVVIGNGSRRPLAGVTRPGWVASLLDARVRGGSAFIDWQGQALRDSEPHEQAGFADRLEFDPAVLAARAGAVSLAEADDAIEIDEAFILIGPSSGRFDQWLLHHVAKYVTASRSRALPAVPVLVDGSLPPRHREALQAVLRDGTPVIELPPLRAARVRRLWCAASPAWCPIGPVGGDGFPWELLAAPATRLAPVRAAIVERLTAYEPAASDDEPLFLTDGAVVDMAEEATQRGFRVVDPRALDLAGQVALVRSARVIAGVGRPALDLACFARPDARIRLLHSGDDGGLAIWHGLFAGSGIDVAVVVDPEARDALFDRGGDRGPGLGEPPAAAWRAVPQPNGLPLVSLYCLAYNQEKFVREAVRSVLAQTYAPLDILVIDDASLDGTAAAIAAELADHPRRDEIRFIRNEQNLGLNASMRKALSLVRGDFIVGCAGDDVMLPHMTEKMVQVWREADVSLVTANVMYIDADGTELNRCYTDPAGGYDDTVETLARQGYNNVTCGAAMAFERQLFLEFGYPPDHLTSEDMMLPFYAYLAKGVRFILEPLMKYRAHPGNGSLGREWERSSDADRLRLEAEMCSIHIAHALEMTRELERRAALDPARLGDLARRIQPLLAQQVKDMTVKLNDTRIELYRLGFDRLIGPRSAREDASHARAVG